MRVIAFVTQKGGSGKSTLASSMAVAAMEAGERVFVFDMDPQRSLVKWAKMRGESDVPVQDVSDAKLAPALADLDKKGVTLCIIDTAGSETASTAAAMKAADLCVIPCRPNAFDLWASETTRAKLKAMDKEFVFLLNQCPPSQQSSRVQEGAAALEAMGGLITPLVQTRVDYQEASRHGCGATEINPSGQAADEMRKLWASVKRRLARAKPKKAAPAASRKAA